MIFLTVGTQFPFDRLVRAIDEVISQNGFEEKIFAQIGCGSYRPNNIEILPSLEKRAFNKYIFDSSFVIGHAGMGTIITSLEYNKPLLVMPRLKKYGEVVNNHQVDIARKFEKLGHILVAYHEQELAEKIQQLRSFVPKPRQNQAKAVANRIAEFLEQVNHEHFKNNH
jgi:UDP-N-acetylglucosamine transferase subunit ALG13